MSDKLFNEIVSRYFKAEELRKENQIEAAKELFLCNIQFPIAPPANYKSLAKIYRAEGNLQEELNILLRFKNFNIGNKQVVTSFNSLINKRVPLLIRRINGELNMSDNDVIYVWRAKNIYFNGLEVYKIGITSQRLGESRVKKVSFSSGFENEVLLFRNSKKAKLLESKMLQFGVFPDFEKFDGRTEFRALNEDELINVLKIGFELE